MGTRNFTYDVVDRITQVSLPGGGSEVFDYFPDGQYKSVSDSTGAQSFTYDRNGVTKTLTDQEGVTTTYTLDALGNQTVARPSGSFTFNWDERARLSTRVGGGTTSFAYEDKVNRTRTTAAAGDVDQRTHDPGGLVTSIQFRPDGASASRLSYAYVYDAQGNLTRVDDVTSAVATVASYTYDGLDRVSSETFTVPGSLPQSRTIQYQFDPQYSRTAMLTATGTTSYVYNPAGQLLSRTDPLGALTTFLYDEAGNLTKMISAAGTTTYTWDSKGMLASVSAPGSPAVSYTYDSFGKRRSKSVGSATTTFSLEDGRLASEATPSGTTRYTYDSDGAPLTITLPSGATYAYHYDSRGSVIALTDANHQVSATYTYDAWGNLVARSGPSTLLESNPYLFKGQFGVRFEEETGFYLMGFRYYDPITGRFVSRDPAAASLTKSSYVYADANPVAKQDPQGLCPYLRDECYKLRIPWLKRTGHVVGGNGYGENTHKVGTSDAYALDFDLVFQKVMSVKEGYVVKVAVDPTPAACDGGGYGTLVVLKHTIDQKTVYSRYAHLSAALVAEDQGYLGWIGQGHTIAKSGFSGNSCTSDDKPAPHLHFAMFVTSVEAYKPEPMSGYTNFRPIKTRCHYPEGGDEEVAIPRALPGHRCAPQTLPPL